MRKLTQEEIIERARKVHGDKYEYLGTIHENGRLKLRIVCPIHGEFKQEFNNHVKRKQGCPNCTGRNRTTDEWVEMAKKKHGDRYDYSKTVYVDSLNKVEIICREHGSFWMIPKDHIKGQGCPRCKADALGDRCRSNTEEFLVKARAKHGDKYDYSKVEYIRSNRKVCIICPEHGEFWQKPNKHLCGTGCPKCTGRNRTTEEWVSMAREVHGDKYDYSKSEYKKSKDKICITCPEHGEFWQLPMCHLYGHGCPSCTMSHLENKIERLLKENGLKYEYETNIGGILKRQSVDFYLPDHNIAIECQGGQHFYPSFNRNDLKKATNIHRNVLRNDLRKYGILKDNNVRVLYFTDISDLPADVFVNEKYQGMYDSGNFFQSTTDLYSAILGEKN